MNLERFSQLRLGKRFIIGVPFVWLLLSSLSFLS